MICSSNLLLILQAASSLLMFLMFSDVRAAQQGETPQDKADSATPEAKTFQFQHVPVDEVAKTLRVDDDADFNTCVNSTFSPVVIRQDDPAGPRYQEEMGYTFFLNTPKFPGLCKMDDGTLVLTLSIPATVDLDGPRKSVVLFSHDDGMSWSQPSPVPLDRCTPINLGGSRIMLRDCGTGGSLVITDDYGKTWSAPERIPALPDGRKMYTDVAMNGLVEGDTVRLIFYTEQPSDISGKTWYKGGWTGQSLIMSYNVKTKQWSEPFFFPKTPEDGPEWSTSEGSLTRAKNGNLVAAFQSRRPKLTNVKSDAWRAIRTSVSTDDGKTWSKPALHSPLGYGLVHMSLQPFPDGRILMTYAARVGEVDGKVYHGIEAVFSYDNGQTWDWQHRYILYRGRDQYMHSPQSVLLSDGRVLTVLMEHINFTHKVAPITRISNTSVVIWSPNQPTPR